MPKLMTIGSVARRLGQPEYRVDYATRTRGIQPAARAGQYRLFDDDAVEKIERAINDMTVQRARHASQSK